MGDLHPVVKSCALLNDTLRTDATYRDQRRPLTF